MNEDLRTTDEILARVGLPPGFGVPQSFALGDILMHEGETGTCLFVIVSGLVEVTVDGQFLSIAGPGETLGEMSLIDDGPRSASAIAIAPTHTLRVDRAAFDKLLGKEATLGRFLMRLMSQRLRQTARMAAASLAALSNPDGPINTVRLPRPANDLPSRGAHAGEAPRDSEVIWRDDGEAEGGKSRV